MAGKLPIDRARARTLAARPYEDHKQTFTQDQVKRDRSPDAPIEPAAPVSDQPDEEGDHDRDNT